VRVAKGHSFLGGFEINMKTSSVWGHNMCVVITLAFGS
jgi:hypothetical protein